MSETLEARRGTTRAATPPDVALPKPLSAPPRALPGAGAVAVLLGIVVIGLAVVGVHDLAVRQGWATTRTEWLRSTVDAVDGLTPSLGLLIGAAVLGVVGVLLVLVAVKPARATHRPTKDGRLDLWLAPGALAALAQSAADRAPGVVAAETVRVSRRKVRIAVTTNREPAPVRQAAQRAAQEAVGHLTRARIDVVTKELPR
ncbi:hypothetical protein INN71_01785 [Nocardioides sp. ChNu-153]|uniref:DUF6286 domain-containing protein n=1 Tax=unclassified Nocardioides TaxID=2615069 RepID=UPI0024068B79|nr:MULTISPECIES: DUF6286 domain-containing protein [unclassified Nocardioides]MDF9714757.1 hypothetical protein [Nocardioides sp. ChNu-99]MDN7120117.1 hypothetical protein [Nocardioides sp. ChNu-153]